MENIELSKITVSLPIRYQASPHQWEGTKIRGMEDQRIHCSVHLFFKKLWVGYMQGLHKLQNKRIATILRAHRDSQSSKLETQTICILC